ncbi:MAG: hypothetical protein ACYTAF_11020 [Planctomycetota bacterium]
MKKPDSLVSVPSGLPGVLRNLRRAFGLVDQTAAPQGVKHIVVQPTMLKLYLIFPASQIWASSFLRRRRPQPEGSLVLFGTHGRPADRFEECRPAARAVRLVVPFEQLVAIDGHGLSAIDASDVCLPGLLFHGSVYLIVLVARFCYGLAYQVVDEGLQLFDPSLRQAVFSFVDSLDP